MIEKIARPFISKRIKEYLGVEEETMIKLVINHIISDQSGNQQGNSAESLLVKVE